MEGIQRYLCETKAACYQAFQTQKDRIKTVSEKVITIAAPYFNRLKSEITKICHLFALGRVTGNLPFNLAILTAIVSFHFGFALGGLISPNLAQLALSGIVFSIIIGMASPQNGEDSQRAI